MGHERNDARSLEYHRVIAARVLDDEAIVQAAQAVVERWRASGTVASYYIDHWSALLTQPRDLLAAAMVDPNEEACALRQASPFTSALTARERWAIWRATPLGVPR